MELDRLRPVIFNPRSGHGDEKEDHLGLIAEEVEEVFPHLVPKDSEGRPASVRYSLLTVLLIAEYQRMRRELEQLKGLLKQ